MSIGISNPHIEKATDGSPHLTRLPRIRIVAVMMFVIGGNTAFCCQAAEPAPVVLQWNAEVGGSPVETHLAPDGRFLMAMFSGGQVVRWNLATGKRMPGADFTNDNPAVKGRTSELWFENCRVLSAAFSVSGTTKLAPRMIGSIDPTTGKFKSAPFEFDKSLLASNSGGSMPAWGPISWGGMAQRASWAG